MAYTWDNRVKFIVRYMYDIDNNGYLDKNDFECLAVKTTIVESKGDFRPERYEQNRKIMRSLWNEITDIADFNKDGQISVDEFKTAVKNLCIGKPFNQFPEALRAFISSHFSTVDINGDGLIGVEEYRVDCCGRQAYNEIQDIDDAFNKLCSDEDKKKGGISLERFQELYAHFLGDPDETIGAVYMFGPLVPLT